MSRRKGLIDGAYRVESGRWLPTPEFTSWFKMMERCYNLGDKHYKDYGGRGIKVCERWRAGFADFGTDMGQRPSNKHSLERIDNDGDYTPWNCKWATAKQQARNRRSNIHITYRGETKILKDWADISGIPYKALWHRYKMGWNVEDMFNRPPRLTTWEVKL